MHQEAESMVCWDEYQIRLRRTRTIEQLRTESANQEALHLEQTTKLNAQIHQLQATIEEQKIEIEQLKMAEQKIEIEQTETIDTQEK